MLKSFNFSKKRNGSMIEKAVEFILSMDDKTLGKLKAEDVAKALNKNQRFLSILFKVLQGISLEKFILRDKLSRAFFILLKDHDITILELSKTLGFAEAEKFEKEFEEYFAISPTMFQDIHARNRDLETRDKPPRKYFEKMRDIYR